jgi:hypothetical protein
MEMNDFSGGVEAMRAKAVEIISGYHQNSFKEELAYPSAFLHDLINAIAGDIRVAQVPLSPSRAGEELSNE